MTSSHLRAYSYIAISMIIVRSTVVSGKVIVQEFPIALASALRSLIILPILFALYWREVDSFRHLQPRSLLLLFIQAFFGFVIFNGLLLLGLRFTSAAESGIIASIYPAVIGLLSFFILRERFTTYRAAAIALAVSGVLIISAFGDTDLGERGSNPLLGNLLVVGAILGEGFFIVLGKIASRTISPIGITAIINFFAVLFFLPFALYQIPAFAISDVPWSGWLALLYWGLVVGVIGSFFLFAGVAAVPTSTAAAFTALVPVSAVLLSYIVLGEQFHWSHLIGIAFVIAAISFVVRDEAQAIPEARAV